MTKFILKTISLSVCCILLLTACSKTAKNSSSTSASASNKGSSDHTTTQEKGESSVQTSTQSSNSSSQTKPSASSDYTPSVGGQASSDTSTSSVQSRPEVSVPDVTFKPGDPLAIPDPNSSYPQRHKTEYYYKSDTIEIDIKQYKTAGSNLYWLAHIIIDSPEQIKGGLANDRYGGFEYPTSASKRLNWILGINGSYFDWGTEKPKGERPVIKNRTSVGTPDTVTTGNEICLMADGRIFSPDKGLTAEQLLEMGVIESWTTYDPLMISSGIKRRTEVINDSHPVGSKNYPRTAIGMVKPCEYYILVAGDLTESSGVSFVKMQDLFYNLGCVYARSFDGGGSSSLVFNHELINVPKGGSERAVVDFLYFTE